LTALEDKFTATAHYDGRSGIADERSLREIQVHGTTNQKCASCFAPVGPPHFRIRGTVELQLEIRYNWHRNLDGSEYLNPCTGISVASDRSVDVEADFKT